MSGTGSNARKLIEYDSPHIDIRVILSDNPSSNYRKISHAYGIQARLNDIFSFCGVHDPGQGLKHRERRLAFDRETDRILKSYDIRLIATAGYDWIISPFLCRSYIIVNVHPGDLRVVDEDGRRIYIGLGWIPTARAILNGERFVYSSTHLVTEDLDGGPIARVSKPVPVNLPESVNKDNILPPGVSLRDIIRDINIDSGKKYSGVFIYTYSRGIQEKLKEEGDWVEFPLTLHYVSGYMLEGRLALDEGAVELDGEPVKDLFLADLKDGGR